MERILKYIISKEYEGQTLQTFLSAQGFSSNSIAMLKKIEESVLINGVWVYMTHKLKKNDCLKVVIREEKSSDNIPAREIPFNIVYEDEDILVVDKPKDMPIHPSLNNYENTLANAVIYYYKRQNKEMIFRCINRLDRDTTGLTIIAKHTLSAGILYADMADRKIKRDYLAIVDKGVSCLDTQGTIDKPIGRDSSSLINRKIDYENGKRAITNYRIEKEFKDSYLIRLSLETGRTHQIRVHLSSIGHSLIGDSMYGRESVDIDRAALHASELRFFHPITKKEMHLFAALPEDMQSYCMKREIC